MPGLRSVAAPRILAVVVSAGAVLTASGCSSKQRLGEYDFRGRTLTVVSIAPPHPEVLSGASWRIDPENPVATLIRIGSEIAREVEADRIRARLDSAAATVDVSGRMADRTLQNAARHLRATPVTGTQSVDYELEIRVRRYGIVASSWTSGAYFLIDADLLLLDGKTGRRIWQTDVRGQDPVRFAGSGIDDRSVTNVVTAIALARMSAGEIQRALESLADFAADQMVDHLAESLDEVRG